MEVQRRHDLGGSSELRIRAGLHGHDEAVRRDVIFEDSAVRRRGADVQIGIGDVGRID
jgi:hypothetical protein